MNSIPCNLTCNHLHRPLQAWRRLWCSNLSYFWLSDESCCLKLLILSKNIKRLGFIHFNLTLNHILDCWIPVTCRLLSPIANNKCNYPMLGRLFLTKLAFLWGKLWKNWNCAVIFCHGRVLKGEITSPIYLSPTQAVQGDNPIVKK